MIELPPLNASLHNVLEFSRVVPFGGPVRHIKMGFDHIVYVPQQQGGPLLNVV